MGQKSNLNNCDMALYVHVGLHDYVIPLAPCYHSWYSSELAIATKHKKICNRKQHKCNTVKQKLMYYQFLWFKYMYICTVSR